MEAILQVSGDRFEPLRGSFAAIEQLFGEQLDEHAELLTRFDRLAEEFLAVRKQRDNLHTMNASLRAENASLRADVVELEDPRLAP